MGHGSTRIIRTWPTDPDQPDMPDAGDVLQTTKGRLWLVTYAKPTRGHPPEARRYTLSVVALDSTEDIPAGATVYELTPARRP